LAARCKRKHSGGRITGFWQNSILFGEACARREQSQPTLQIRADIEYLAELTAMEIYFERQMWEP
jgi:hypothetical protein